VAAVSRAHANAIFRDQFSPQNLMQQVLRAGPDILEALAKSPSLITEGLRLLEQVTHRPENPLAGLRGTLFGGFCMVAGAILAGAHGPWPVWSILFAVGILAALHRSRR